MPDDEPKFRFRDLHPISKGIFFIIIILAVIGSISNDPIVFGGNIAKIAISFAIGWFITGPVCWEWAYKKDRNTDFAFLFGFFLSIPGAILYWIYQLFFKKKPDNLEVQHISSERKPKFCTTCGVPLQFENADICPNCGVKIQAQPIPGKSGLFWLSVVLAVLLIIGAVITAFFFGVAGLTQKVPQSDGTNTLVNTYTVVQTYAPIETLVAPVLLYQRPSPIPPGYNQLKNDDLQFSIYIPNDWDSYIIDSKESTSISEDASLSESVLPKIVYFYNKKIDASKSMIMIMGMDFTKSAWGENSLEPFNDGFVGGLKQGIEKSQATNIVVMSKGEKYRINGYEALGNRITYITSNGIPSTMKTYVIKTGSIYYVIYFIAVNEVYSSQINTVESIVGSFIPSSAPASSQTYISPSSTSDSIQVSGNGNGVKPFTVTGTGLSEFSMSYSGQQNFIVRLRDSEGKYIELLANEIGSYSGKKTAKLSTGKYTLDITAFGPWKIDISSI